MMPSREARTYFCSVCRTEDRGTFPPSGWLRVQVAQGGERGWLTSVLVCSLFCLANQADDWLNTAAQTTEAG